MSRRPIPRISRVGVDVGGTFTDIVLIDPSGAIQVRKLPSTPEDFSRGVTDGVRHVLDRHDVDPGSVRDVVHGSTVATNAILERKGARTGLLTTEGFRDVLELRRLRMPRLYDMTWQKPAPLVERSLRREVPERVDIDGEVVTPLDLAAVRVAVAGARRRRRRVRRGQPDPLVREHDPRARDRRPARATEFPDLWVSLSHRVLPVIREYERTSTTVINAYVQPTVASYLGALRSQLDDARVDGPLLIMQSNGGIMAGAAAAERPAYIVESGPAAGVIARRRAGATAPHRRGHQLRHGWHDGQGLARRGRPAAISRPSSKWRPGSRPAAGCRAVAGMP